MKKVTKVAKILKELKNFKVEKVILHQVDIFVDPTYGFGTRSVEATKITDPDGVITYSITLEQPE